MTTPRILLIDDDLADRSLAAALIRDALPNVELVEVSGAVEFAECYRRRGWTVVVGERHLGWTDGVAALRMLKERNPNCTTIMFTQRPPEMLGVVEYSTNAFEPNLYIRKVTTGYLNLVETVGDAVSSASPTRVMTSLAERAERLEADVSEIVETNDNTGSRAAHEFRRLQQSTKRLGELFDTATVDTTAHSDVDVKRAVRGAMWTLAKELRRSRIRVRSAELPIIRADAIGMHNFFRTILEFVLAHAGDTESVVATLRMRARSEDSLLSVHLEGVHASRRVLGKLFDGEPGRANAGELAECARFAHNHGGKMWVEVDPDGGIHLFASLSVVQIDPVAIEIQHNGLAVGNVSVVDRQDQREITQAAFNLPSLSRDLAESTIKLVEFPEEGVVNIVT
ncbi:MAG: hypothetical protein AAF493_28095 [Pseudomonadota bacterium]